MQSSDRSSFPSAPQAALLLLAGFVLQYFLGAALYDLRLSLGFSREQVIAFVMLLANGILITVMMHIRGLTYRDLLHPTKASPLATLIFLVPPILLVTPLLVLLDGVLVNGLESVFPVSAWEEQAFATMVERSIPAFVATCLIAPAVEEMLFRGILLRSFLARYPRGLAIGYSALYFGAAHLNIYQFFVAFLLGLLLGLLYERSRSLIPTIAMHAAVNVCIFLWGNSNDTASVLNPSYTSTSAWVFSLLAACTGAIALRKLLAAKGT